MSGWDKFMLAWTPVLTGLAIYDVVGHYTNDAIFVISAMGFCLFLYILRCAR
jgi:hypothetical protein